MVREANVKQATAEKQLKEALGKVRSTGSTRGGGWSAGGNFIYPIWKVTVSNTAVFNDLQRAEP